MTEAGLPDLDLASPAGIPAPVVTLLNREASTALGAEEMRSAMARRVAREGALHRRIIADAQIGAE